MCRPNEGGVNWTVCDNKPGRNSFSSLASCVGTGNTYNFNTFKCLFGHD